MQLLSQQSSHFVSPRWPIDLPVLQAIFPSKQTSNSYWWLRPHHLYHQSNNNEIIFKILTGRWQRMSCGTQSWGTGQSLSLNGRGKTHVAGCGESQLEEPDQNLGWSASPEDCAPRTGHFPHQSCKERKSQTELVNFLFITLIQTPLNLLTCHI